MPTLEHFAGLRQGLLLDADYVTLEGRAAVRLWVRSEGQALALLDHRFEPYFYVVVREEADMPRVHEQLRRLDAGGARPVRVEVMERREGLRTLKVLRLTAYHPQDVPRLREAVKEVPGVLEHREADIPFAFRYLIDHDLRPMGGIAFDAAPSGKALSLRHVEPRDAPGAEPDVGILSFDLEVYNPRIVPRVREDPILIISVATSTGQEQVLQAQPGPRGDKEPIQRFLDLLRTEDPDVIVTYNGDEFDWPYLLERARLHGLRLNVGRDGSEPSTRQAGLHRVVSITGRENVDLLRIAQRDLGEVKVKTLKNVADFLGVTSVEERTMVRKDRIHAMWDDPEQRKVLLAYARDDARSTLHLAQKLLPLQYELARMTRMPLDEESKMGRGRQVDWFLLAEAHRRGMLAPGKAFVQDEVYEGGLVLEPAQGLHDDIVALDFSSMYPSIMVAHNVSPETFVPDEVAKAFRAEELWQAPEVGHRFLKEPQGFFPAIVDELVGTRKRWKQQLRATKPGSPEHAMANVKQQTLKILTNAFYGYTGWAGARWHKRECAEATTAWGRTIVRGVIEDARAMGLEVLYGDTDSLFVKDDPRIPAFLAAVNERQPLELDVQERFGVLFFTGAKKRYAGLTKEGKVIARGLEVRRGDWCELAKELQEGVLDKVLRDRDPKGAVKLAQEAVQRVLQGKAGIEELTIYKTLTMDPGEYKAKQAHVHALERAQARQPDYKAATGTKIGYLITKPKGATKDALPSERAVLVDFLEPRDEPDAQYYVDKQLLPAALRILEHFGVSEQDLKGAPKQQSLKDWF
ncbi:MAG: DNA-directed DNA polymerase [Halobacteriales archaeon]|nr:DNA-directed DNA polymerase [Halobacteriales archaeon]